MIKVKDFIKKLEGKNGVSEISNLHQNLGGLEDLDKIMQKEDSLYFVSFVPSWSWKNIRMYGNTNLPRTKQKYIIQKSYFVCDMDIRSYIYEHENGRVISNEELMAYLPKIEEGLKSDKSLSTYNAIVFSGNGFHIYWIGEAVYITADLYAKATAAIYDRIKSVFKDTPELRPDYSGSNIAHLFRLPGTLNKKEKYGLPPIEVKLIYFDKDSNSPLVAKLREIGERAKDQEEKRIAEDLKAVKKYKPSWEDPQGYFGGRSRYDIINQDIKIGTLVRKYTGWLEAENGKNFISRVNGGYTGAYIIPEENVVVHMGTPHFSDYYRVYSPFSFILVHYADGDVKRAFQMAKILFPTLHIVNEQYLGHLPDKEIRYGTNG